MKRITLFLLMLCVLFASYAAPAYRKKSVVRQSDGTSLTVVLTGDEAMHYFSTLDGKPLVKESNGDFSYARFTADGFVSTKLLAHDSGSRTIMEKSLLASIDYEPMSVAAASRATTYRAAAQRAGSQITPLGDVNVAVVLVQFQDEKFTYTKEDMENLLNTEGFVYENPIANSIGSARDYFIAQSDGKFRPNFLVTDIVTLDNNMEYYGANDSKGNDLKAAYAVREGISKASAAGFDFSKCDNNGDGEVEFVYCIYAGYSESYGAADNTIWPHQWSLSEGASAINVNGVKCNTYACSGELVYNEDYEAEMGRVLAGIGLICHEFSHCLGLHDIYDVTYESGNWGMDYWDVMDQGNYAAEGYVPVGYSAYQRDFCGWRDLVVLEEKGNYSMPALTQGGVGYKIVNDANPNEYYILENRKCENWDTYLFGQGMLVIHVDYLKTAWDSNEINTTAGHPRYTLIPADNKLDVYGEVSAQQFVASLKGDVWPGTTGNTELTNTSIPAAKVYKGGYMNKPVTGIKYENYVISFDFMQGVFDGVPQLLPSTEITETSFVANWEALKGATSYDVELYKVTEASNGTGETVELLKEDFLSCSKTNELLDDKLDSYLSVPGWSGSKLYGEGGVLRVGTKSNAGNLVSPQLSATGEVTVLFNTALYNSSDTGVLMTVSATDANGNELGTLSVSPAAYIGAETFTFEANGDFSITFTTNGSTGAKRASVDDITVSAVSSVERTLVAAVNTVETSYSFNELESGLSYVYRVRGGDGVGYSGYSLFGTVSLLSTGIESVVMGDNDVVELYTVGGILVYSGKAGNVPQLNSGIYILKNGTSVVKLVVE